MRPIPLFVAVAAVVLSFAAEAQTRTEQLQKAWRAAIVRTAPPDRHCYEASYPLVIWIRTACVAGPRQPFLPASGMHQSGPTGNRNDYAAVSQSHISYAIGSFPKVQHLESETGDGDQPDSYSLQLNSNFMPDTPACAGAAVPANCSGWEQFIYSSGFGAVFIQYWLYGYGNKCPKGWIAYKGSCHTSGKATPVPLQKITELPNLELSGQAVHKGANTVVLTAGTKAYKAPGSDDVVSLADGWTEAEFNVVGDANGSRANFNTGTALTVRIDLNDGTKNAPDCLPGHGTTGETNNLELGKCISKGGRSAFVQFTEALTGAVDAMHLAFDGDYRDDSGNGNNGAGYGNLSFQPGYAPPDGKALAYLNVPSGVTVEPKAGLDLRADLSVALWFYPGANQAQRYSALLYKAAELGDSPSVHFSDRSVALFWVPGGIHSVYTLDGDTSQTICTDTDFGLASERWHHLAFTFDSKAGQAKLYLDGSPAKTCTFKAGRNLRAGNKRIGVGSTINTQLQDTGTFLGMIDSAHIYQGVLTAKQVEKLFSNRQ